MNTGGAYTCAVTASHKAFCWGGNTRGALGDGTTTRRLTPVAVVGGLKFRRVVAGAAHTCGVTTTDKAYCWGDSDFGKLDNGSIGDRLVPTAVAGGLTFKQVNPGNAHTCAVGTDARAYCWGYTATVSSATAARATGPPHMRSETVAAIPR